MRTCDENCPMYNNGLCMVLQNERPEGVGCAAPDFTPEYCKDMINRYNQMLNIVTGNEDDVCCRKLCADEISPPVAINIENINVYN